MNPDRRLLVLACSVAAWLPAAAIAGQQPRPPVSWSARIAPGAAPVRTGSHLVLAVTATIQEGWHVYGPEELPNGPRPLRITVAAGQPFTAGKLEAPEPDRELDSAFNQVTAFYSKTTTFRLPVTVAAGTSPGPREIALEIRFQACDGRICLPGRTTKLSVPVTVEKGRPTP